MRVGSLSESLEDYLEIIYQLIQEKGEARVKDIADRKEVSMSSVTSALKRLAKEKLIKHSIRSVVKLTDDGRQLADSIVARHKFIKYFFMSLLDIPEEIAEKDACIFEHYMSPETFRMLVIFFEFIDTCGMDIRENFSIYRKQIDSVKGNGFYLSPECPYKDSSFHHRHRRGLIKTLMMLKPGEKGRVARIQAPDNIRQRLIDMGLLPNVEITLERVAPLGDPIEIKLRGYHLSLRKEEANSIILYPQDDRDIDLSKEMNRRNRRGRWW